jgi:hypothetical protein
MIPELQQVLFKHQRLALSQITELASDVKDLEASTFFNHIEPTGKIGFKNEDCAGTVIMLPGPKEANKQAHMHIEEHYDARSPHELKFYRYEICWSFDIVLPAPQNDYLRDSMITLRRGVRFDHHPQIQDPHHPPYHWHPNGCSELRLSTGKMSPLKVAIVAILMFDRGKLETANSACITNAINELRREMPSLPLS